LVQAISPVSGRAAIETDRDEDEDRLRDLMIRVGVSVARASTTAKR
jgi:hypothetical protein